MRPDEHFEPAKKATFMTNRPALQLTYAIEASRNLFLQHIDFRAAFLHEDCYIEKWSMSVEKKLHKT